MFCVYGMTDSGNCYKVKLALEQLALPYRWIEVDPARGETRSHGFLAMNPNGKVPTLALEDGTHLAESNALLHYLAHGSPLYIAVARSIERYQPPDSPRRGELARLLERGNQALTVMEWHLEREPFFAAGRYSIADIALYAYTHCAADGGFDLAAYPALGRWLERVRSQSRHVSMLG